MRIKSIVKFGNPTIAICAAMMVAEEIFIGLGYAFTMTSFNDSKHMVGSLHYSDRAFDCRTTTQNMKPQDIDNAFAQFKERLSIDFDVVKEVDHIHIEYQPK